MSLAGVALSPVQEELFNFPGNATSRCGLPPLNDSILVYLSVAGSLIPMHIMESDSIASVKLRIQSVKGFFVKKQKLVFEGRELARSNSFVRDYGVGDGNVLHLVLRLSDLQAITVHTACGKEFEFQVERSRNVGYVKQQIAKKGGKIIDLNNQELVCDGEELEDQKLIYDISKKTDAVIHLLVQKSAKVRAKPVNNYFEVSIDAPVVKKVAANSEVASAVEQNTIVRPPSTRNLLLEALVADGGIELPPLIKELISSTLRGLEMGNAPIQSSEGSGGAYLMQDSSGQGYISVFKPVDEEPLAVNNPRGLPMSVDGQGLKKGTRVGEGALREVAAYILDYPLGGSHSFYKEEKGFSGVPPTVMVKCLHKGFNHPGGCQYAFKNVKIGSLQMYMKNNGSCEDMGPRDFPVHEVHKISVLDIRLANADRHSGNVLISRDGETGEIVLIPIDHGYCLPENFEDCTFDWLYWPQAKQPYSPETIDYIQSLDAEKDIQLLSSHGWDLPLESARTLRISTMLLKKAASRGFTPFFIGTMMCRRTLKEESAIELIVQEAEDKVLPGASEAAFLELVESIMDRYLDAHAP